MKYCFVNDGESSYSQHIDEVSWYLIPLELRTKFFQNLTGYALDFLTREDVELKFNQYKLNTDVENYSFENPEEI